MTRGGHSDGQHTEEHDSAAGTGGPAGHPEGQRVHHDEEPDTDDHAHHDESSGTADADAHHVRCCDESQARVVVGDDKDTEVEGATCEARMAVFLAHFGTNHSDNTAAQGD